MKVGLTSHDALCQSKWIVDVNLGDKRMRGIWPPSPTEDTTDLRHLSHPVS